MGARIVRLDADGATTWTDPTGRTRTTTPQDLRILPQGDLPRVPVNPHELMTDHPGQRPPGCRETLRIEVHPPPTRWTLDPDYLDQLHDQHRQRHGAPGPGPEDPPPF